MNTKELINLLRLGGIPAKGSGYYMPGNFFVPIDDILLAWKNATTHIDGINWRKQVSSASFFDEDDWQSFIRGKRHALGRCIKFFCVQDLLPIEVVNQGKTGKRLYRRKPERQAHHQKPVTTYGTSHIRIPGQAYQ
jgi:hypothetical protein